MPLPTLTGLPPDAQYSEIVAKINKMVQELRNLLLSLDTLNVVELDAQVIIAETITTEKLAAGSITATKIATDAVETDKIKAGAVTANKITVSQLSAISANMGEITAGSITTNAEINVGTDARIGNILYLNETDSSGTKGIVFDTNTGTSAEMEVISGDMSLRLDGFLALTTGSSMGLVVNGDKVADESLAKSAGFSLDFDAGTKLLHLKDFFGNIVSTVYIGP